MTRNSYCVERDDRAGRPVRMCLAGLCEAWTPSPEPPGTGSRRPGETHADWASVFAIEALDRRVLNSDFLEQRQPSARTRANG
jgi:hypothetical protein